MLGRAAKRLWSWVRGITARTCPLCGQRAQKVLIAGLPMKLCKNTRNELVAVKAAGKSCGCIWGFWTFTLPLTFNGWMMSYRGSYWRALWQWLKWTSGR